MGSNMTNDYVNSLNNWYDVFRTPEESSAGQSPADQPLATQTPDPVEKHQAKVSPQNYHLNLQREYAIATAALQQQLLGNIHVQTHQFFEQLVIDVLLALGYGGRKRDVAQRLGKSGDGGIDGIISLDALGLDVLYIQAKRLRPGAMVAISDVRDFVGSLEAKHANKGVFISTGHFTPATKQFVTAVSRKVILVNGTKLTEMMVRHNIGVVTSETFQFKTLEPNYFQLNTRALQPA
jgi:restriction system protein